MNDSTLPGDEHVGEWRGWFPVTERWVYLNHAAVAPISIRAHEAMTGLLDDVLRNGAAGARNWSATCASARDAVASLLATDQRRIAFAKNTSEGLNFVAGGCRWNAGDEVVTAAMEFPANRFPWLNLAREGVRTVLLDDDEGCLPANRIIAAMTEKTRVVALSAVQYASGWRADLGTVGKACRERDILFVVDGIQALGALRLHPEEHHIDVLAADAHKWLLGPEGIAVVYFSDRALERLRVAEVGWSSVAAPGNYEEQSLALHPHARRFECGTMTTVGLYGLRAAVALIEEVGIGRIERRVLALADFVRKRCGERGWPVFGPRGGGGVSGIVSFSVPKDARMLVRNLRERGVQVAARSGRVRMSPHFYNTVEEIDRAFTLLDSLV